MLFCVVFGGRFNTLRITFVGTCWWGLSVCLDLIGAVKTSFGMVWCFRFDWRGAVDSVIFVVIGWLCNSMQCAIGCAESESGRSGFLGREL